MMSASTRCLDTTLKSAWYGFLLEVGSRMNSYRGASVTNDRYRRNLRPNRRTGDVAPSRVLPTTADPTAGVSNLASKPRAGNISSDTRAGYAR
jgi:hypothetical protein